MCAVIFLYSYENAKKFKSVFSLELGHSLKV